MNKLNKARSQFMALMYAMFAGEMTINNASRRLRTGTPRKQIAFFNQLGFVGKIILYCICYGLIGFFGVALGNMVGSLGLSAAVSIYNKMLIIITLIFGLLSMCTILFFSKDIVFYFSLPIKASSLVKAKISQYFLTTSPIDICMFVPMLVTVCYLQGLGVGDYLKVILYCLATIIANQCILLLVLLWLMRKLKIFKNKDRVISALSTFLMIAAVFIGIGVQFIFNGNSAFVQNQTGSLQNLANSAYSNGADYALGLFSWPMWLFKAIFGSDTWLSYVGLLLAVLIAVIIAGLTLNLFKNHYLDTVIYIHSGSANKKVMTTKQLNQAVKGSSCFKSWRFVDISLIKRSPVLRTQMYLSPLIMPLYTIAIFAVVFYMNKSTVGSLANSLEMARQVITWRGYGLTLLLLCLSFFMTININGSTLNEFARDGRNFYFYKSLPVSLKSYIMIKYQRIWLYYYGLLLAISEVLILVLRLDLVTTLIALIYLLAFSNICALTSTFIGIMTADFASDSEEEFLRSVRGFKSLGLSMLTVLSIVVVPALIFLINTRFNFASLTSSLENSVITAINLEIFGAFIILNFVAYYLVFNVGEKILRKK